MFSKIVATPLAGSQLNSRLRSLLLAYGSYAPPPTSLNSMTIPQPTKVPKKLLTEELIEEIKTRCCFVGDEVTDDDQHLREYDTELRQQRRSQSSTITTFSSPVEIDSGPDVEASFDDPEDPDGALLRYLQARYARTCPSTTSLSFRVPHLSSPPAASGIGKGHLSIPSWIRERAVEVLFDTTLETRDSLSIQSAILECVLDLPVDLRRPMLENLVVTGGTASLPGFIPRLKESLLTRLRESRPPSPPPSPPPFTPPSTSTRSSMTLTQRSRLSNRLHRLRHSPRYAPLVSLSPSLSILNNPSPVVSVGTPVTEGSAPAFHPSLYAWVGGSLAGSLKIGGKEIVREHWDEGFDIRAGQGGGESAKEGMETGQAQGLEEDERGPRRRKRLPDWSGSY